MVDRIDKTDRVDNYWKVKESAETHKEKQDTQKDGYSGFQEKTDWHLLFDKSKLWKKNIQIPKEEIDQILFGKVNLKTDPSLLRIDVKLKDGESISPAFLAISRIAALKIKNFHAGESIPLNFLLQNNVLNLTIPLDPGLFIEPKEKQIPASPTIPTPNKSNVFSLDLKKYFPTLADWAKRAGWMDPNTNQFKLEIILIYGIIIFVFFLFFWGMHLLR